MTCQQQTGGVHIWRLSLQTLGTREGTLQQELEQAKKDLKSARQAAVLAEASARRANGEAGEVEDKHRAELRAAHEETEVVSLASCLSCKRAAAREWLLNTHPLPPAAS